jgi:guanosine-3',5'-bis(diphosphate) 3'-pyrophosphohydrolase
VNQAQILDRVEAFATKSHGEQMRKYTPEPYMVHPVRVMKLCREYTEDTAMLAAALLHDVLEDTPVDAEAMFSFLKTVMDEATARQTLKLVVELTDEYVKEKYPRYNRKRRKELERQRIAGTDPDAQTIKYADIIDNCREIVEHDPHFAKIFLNECRGLLRVIQKGDARLFEKATGEVDKAIKNL